MKYSELEKLLRKAGCWVDHEGKNHTMWHSPITNKTFPVGRHKNQDVKKGTLKAIKDAAGLE